MIQRVALSVFHDFSLSGSLSSASIANSFALLPFISHEQF